MESPAPGHPDAPSPADREHRHKALRFVILLGVVSLFADITYEGARSITGPFLFSLGASGLVVGFVAGMGELVGYGLRLVSGYWADRTRRYWAIAITGYVVNLLSVPALALAGSWQAAVALMILERAGKAVRNPSRDVMLSHAAARVGRGWGFGLHEALDQIGAILGPLIASAVLARTGNHRQAFALLGVAAVLALLTLAAARITFPRPGEFEPSRSAFGGRSLGRAFWLYLTAAALVAAGYADFPLIAFRIERDALAGAAWIPVLYAIAMGVDALAALAFGKLFDRFGLPVLAAAIAAASAFAPLVFFGDLGTVAAGMVCWGLGMGAQESILRAAIADMVPAHRRGTAFGIFNAGFGLAWFAGSALMGWLLDLSVFWLVAFSVSVQLVALPVLLLGKRRR